MTSDVVQSHMDVNKQLILVHVWTRCGTIQVRMSIYKTFGKRNVFEYNVYKIPSDVLCGRAQENQALYLLDTLCHHTDWRGEAEAVPWT